MRVLSLFDGMSCGRLALEKAGIPVEAYHASEVDVPAMKVSAHNWPDIVHLGDVTKLTVKPGEYDLVIGGSPCTTFSHANQFERTGFEGSSGLFFHYVRLLKEAQPKWFLLENVKMKKEWRDVISREMGVEPVEINSRLVSAQNRPRLYWVNFPVQPLEDRGLVVRDILEPEMVAPKWYLSEKARAYMGRLRGSKPRWEHHANPLEGKAACLTANMWKGVPYGVVRARDRRLTCEECEALQTVPRGYTDVPGVGDSARLKMLGNGWTVDVIAHLFRGIKDAS